MMVMRVTMTVTEETEHKRCHTVTSYSWFARTRLSIDKAFHRSQSQFYRTCPAQLPTCLSIVAVSQIKSSANCQARRPVCPAHRGYTANVYLPSYNSCHSIVTVSRFYRTSPAHRSVYVDPTPSVNTANVYFCPLLSQFLSRSQSN